MRKTIRLQDLDCANCAAKIENGISVLDGVLDVKVNFMGQKMILEAPDDIFDKVLAEAKEIAGRIEPDLLFLN